jgi:hypothetical protein
MERIVMPRAAKFVFGTIETRRGGTRERLPRVVSMVQARSSKVVPSGVGSLVPSPAQASSARAWSVRSVSVTPHASPLAISARGRSRARERTVQ